MKISDNILKHHLKNVYFLNGTAFSGKTTMAKLIEKKHNFVRYRGGDEWPGHRKFADEKYQPALCYQRDDFNIFFNRPVSEFAKWLYDTQAEQAEMMIIDLIKISQHQQVIADIMIPVEYLLQLTNYDHIILLLAPPEMICERFFDREDKKPMFDCIMELPNPEKSLENFKSALMQSSLLWYKQFIESGFKCIIRNEKSTIQDTLQDIEIHFKLTDK